MKKQKLFVILMALLMTLTAPALAVSGSLKAGNALYSAAPAAQPVSAVSRDDLAGQVVDLVNAERAKLGLGGLRVDAGLVRAAQVRAQEIARVFSHTRPDGSSWSTVSAAAFGENIARGQRSAQKVMAAWMTSSNGHRQTILHPSYGSIGVACIKAGGVMYWVQLFGK